ncbi:MAG: pyruvate, phosphate dikinase [delta proteobacterium ML8_F1]|nr:MAG: pyruvate, phosphate dikinase [delta proteobacterium ML8_F1]
MKNQFVYEFEAGNKGMKGLLGGKGANLAEMSKIGLPVPEGFTITTEACIQYYKDDKKITDTVKEEILQQLKALEAKTGKGFGLKDNPLLVSVRSGAAVSMPGMMDTILNLGLNFETVKGLEALTGNGRFAMDSFRRFIQMFSDVVLGISKHSFDIIFDGKKQQRGIKNDFELTKEDLAGVIEDYLLLVKTQTQKPFPMDPEEQLFLAIDAVFDSWNNQRAIIYRNAHDIPHDMGTAVNVQSMVFGNMGETSGTGVAFTRNPSTGENGMFGEFLMNAQGEDVVAGIRTPMDIKEMETVMPGAYEEFVQICSRLEHHYKDMQDIEFTIEKEKLYILQTRTGKRTAAAAINVAVDMVKDGIITKSEAIMRVEPEQIDKMLHPDFDPEALEEALLFGEGLPASPGAATGKIYFFPEDVVRARERGEKAILVRQETSPEDIEGMINAEGILTSRGGMTSHAAVVARGMGKCCVAGAGDILVDEVKKEVKAGGVLLKEGDYISLNGSTGKVYSGKVPVTRVNISGNFNLILEWADEIRELGVRTNADTPRDSRTAVEFGAEGIGLCRTEHMFFDESRINIVREMILARNLKDRQKALTKLLPFQREDFKEIFKVMEERPVTIRLLDPPLHEFLPKEEEDILTLAGELGISPEAIKDIVKDLAEFNPMLGHRGVRLAISYPEIYEMQVRAIFEGALEAKAETGRVPKVEIMVPLVGLVKEFTLIKAMVHRIAEEIFEGESTIPYKVGTMIEVPRAAIVADKIAAEAEFFSFGTNDLTQMALGFSRDDSGKFLAMYKEKGIFEKDPFSTIDVEGVGRLVEMGTQAGRGARADLKVGICGEHGGDPKSIAFFHSVGLDYVSCSPYRVPVARLSAAQAKIRSQQ